MTTAERPIAFCDVRAQHASIAPDISAAIERVVESGDFILGGEVAAFEEEFAAYCEAAHAVGVDSGTSALELTLRACGIGNGDEVVTVANSFVATALAITHTGARPVFVDADPRTNTINVEALADAITARCRAVVPVHLYGQPADIDGVLALARRHGLKVIEDACQAHGARYHRRRVGSLGHAAAFSFYPSKNLGGIGDGGMVVTSDAELADALRRLRNYGQVQKNVAAVVGYNRRLDTLQAAVLRVKLRHLDEWNDARRRIAAAYSEQLADDEQIETPAPVAGTESVWHLYVVQVQRRDAVRERLFELGIETGVHYPVPIPYQDAYAEDSTSGRFSISERAATRVLSMPMHPLLTEPDVAHVCEALRSAAAKP